MIPQPRYTATVNYTNASNSDIINVLEGNYKTAVLQCRTFAQRFKGGRHIDTAKNIFDYLRTIKYNRDSNEYQKIKLPARFIADGTGDCKSYSLLTAGILGALKMPVRFIYTSYDPGDATPTHVYVETETEQGRPIIIDGVFGIFNREKKPAHKIKHNMQVITLAGIQGPLYLEKLEKIIQRKPGSICSKLAKREIARVKGERVEPATGAEVEQYKRVLAKYYQQSTSLCGKLMRAEINGITGIEGKFFKKLANGTKKIALSPGRTAFLELVRLNVHRLAATLAKLDAKKIQAKWEKLGGNWSKLKEAIDKGKNKKSILGIGADPATLLAAAAPVLIAMALLIKSLKKDSKISDAEFASALTLANDSTKAAFQSEFYGKGNDALPSLDDPKVIIEDKGTGPDNSSFNISPKVLLMVGGGLIAAKVMKVF